MSIESGMIEPRPTDDVREECRSTSTAFLLAQVGAHAAMAFAGRLAKLGLAPPHAGILRMLSVDGGLSQRALATRLSILPSRLVQLVDELEQKGLVERRSDPDDRRTHALHLTSEGRRAMGAIGEVARAHDEAMCAALSAGERTQLASLLGRIAREQGLTADVHPGYSRLGRGKDRGSRRDRSK